MLLKTYRTLSLIATPFLALWFSYRKKIGKEDAHRFSERCGQAGFPRPEGHLIWIHGASVGEIISVLPLIKKICDTYPSLNLLVTTGTVTSAKILESRLPKKAIHQYVPIDKLPFVKKFLAHWKPDFAIFIESELWPNLIIETKKTGCPMAAINARMSVKSFATWQKYNSLALEMLSCFNVTLAQSHEDKDRYVTLGAPHAKYLGNLKYDAPPLPADPKETGKLITMIHNRPVWIAASTHPDEEQLIAEAHGILRQDHPNLLLIIIPRHPERGTEIAALLQDEGYKTALRSKNQEINDNVQIYIADTIGELGIFYRLSGIVFMGGSLVDHGGQNPLEAARLECALLTGPATHNFVKIYKELEVKNALLRVNNVDELAENINTLLKDHEKQEALSNTALALMESKKGVLDKYLNELEPFLKPLAGISTNENT